MTRFKLTLAAMYLLAFAGIAIAAPVVHNLNGIAFTSGGVGEDDVAELEANESPYNVKIISAFKTGEYSGPFTLVIRDAKGNAMFNTQSDGPLFYATMPAGSYEFDVAVEGEHQTRKISVPQGGKLQTLHFTWKRPTE